MKIIAQIMKSYEINRYSMVMRMNDDAKADKNDNPFDYNPFMAYERHDDGNRPKRDAGENHRPADVPDTTVNSGQNHATEDDETQSEDQVLSLITETDDENAEDDISEGDDDGITILPPDGNSDDDGYSESMRRDHRKRVIVVIASVIAVLAFLIAVIWALGTNPLHIGELDGDYPPANGKSQEFRGSGCRIDGQSCSSDDNGNHPAG